MEGLARRQPPQAGIRRVRRALRRRRGSSPPRRLPAADAVCRVAGFAVEPILAAAYMIRTLVLLGLLLLGLGYSSRARRRRARPFVFSTASAPYRHPAVQMQDVCERRTLRAENTANTERMRCSPGRAFCTSHGYREEHMRLRVYGCAAALAALVLSGCDRSPRADNAAESDATANHRRATAQPIR